MMEIIDVEQGSEEWFRARMGMPTASCFSDVMAQGKTKGEPSKTRRTYMLKLAGEIITGEPTEPYTNAHMERGKAMEDDARTFYQFLNPGGELQRVGFVRTLARSLDLRASRPVGCSPDALIGKNGALEIKTALPHILGALILADVFPSEHAPQCQGTLWVTEREWIDLIVFWPKMPTFIKRAYRDEAYIKRIAAAVEAFNIELHETVSKLRAYGMAEAA